MNNDKNEDKSQDNQLALIVAGAQDLLAAARATNENEAAGAAADVQAIIVLNRITNQCDRGAFGATRLDEIGIEDHEEDWSGILVHGIALANDCWSRFAYGDHGRTFRLVGRELDRQLLGVMVTYLIREVRRLGEGWATKAGQFSKDSQATFGRGAADMILTRIRSERWSAQRRFGQMLDSEYEDLAAYYRSRYGADPTSGDAATVDHTSEAYRAGSLAGSRIEIRKEEK